MPNLDNARKSLRQAKKRALQNKMRRDAYKGAMKDAEKNPSPATMQKAQKALDKAAKTGAIKKNTAARKLSRLMKRVGAARK